MGVKGCSNRDFFTDIPDTGCRYSPSCLNCHLPECVLMNEKVYDLQSYNRHRSDIAQNRNPEIVRLHNEGVPKKELMEKFHLSRCAINRIIRTTKQADSRITLPETARA